MQGQLPWNNTQHRIQTFTLTCTADTAVALTQYTQAKGFIVVFTCNHCPFAKLYSKRLNALNAKYAPMGVPLLAINSIDTLVYSNENLQAMAIEARKRQYDFPYLWDADQQIAKQFNAQHTPQAFVIWKTENAWQIQYSGAIDNNGAEPQKATQNYVSNAINDLLNFKPVAKPLTESFGCKIYYRASK
jgi:peroxiredoxin